MIGLLELREKLKWFYSRYEAFILPGVKFLLALIVLGTINGQMKYMAKLDHFVIVLIAALACSFLPTVMMLFLAALFTALHMYALAMEVAAVGLSVYLLMFLLFMRFCPKDSIVVILTPLLFHFKIPYVMPVAMGLIGGPSCAVSVGCGVVAYFVMNTVTVNANTISTMGSEEAAGKIRLMLDGIVANKQMMVMAAAFVITVIVVYLLRRMSMDYAWTIAMIAGSMTELVILLVGDLLYDTNVSLLGAILGAALSVAVGKGIEFFRFCVDYSRTEKVQFEDDEYYYYVKAVPKMTVTAPNNTVKKINVQHSVHAERGRADRDDGGEPRRPRLQQPGQRGSRAGSVGVRNSSVGRGSAAANRGRAATGRSSASMGRGSAMGSHDIEKTLQEDNEEIF